MKTNRIAWVFIQLLLLNAAVAEMPATGNGKTCLRVGNNPFDEFTRAEPTTNSPDKSISETIARAEQGDVIAQHHMGSYYEFNFPAPDFQAAVKWYRKAAEQGDAISQRSLGVCYDLGQGIAQDYSQAAVWYLKAAKKGDVRAQNNLGAIYHDGLGHYHDGLGVIDNLPYRSYEKAVQWFQKAANQGLREAQINLSWCYGKGEGVPPDFVEAYKWASLAATEGTTNAVQLRGLLRQQMTPEQVAEGQQLARDFKPHRTGSSKAVSDSKPSASGTGFFITTDGYLISNEHVVKDATQIRVLTSAGLISAKVVKVDAANDLALLKAEGKFSPLPVASSRSVKLGATVATVGFPNIGLQGFAPKLAKGEIASLSGAGDDARYFQISVPVQPGNSGGALVDERGNVVGVVSAKLSAKAALAASGSLPENVNYAVKSSFLLGFLESVPEVAAKLAEPNPKEQKFEDVVKSAEQAAVLVLVY